jgi:hypothetical protein
VCEWVDVYLVLFACDVDKRFARFSWIIWQSKSAAFVLNFRVIWPRAAQLKVIWPRGEHQGRIIQCLHTKSERPLGQGAKAAKAKEQSVRPTASHISTRADTRADPTMPRCRCSMNNGLLYINYTHPYSRVVNRGERAERKREPRALKYTQLYCVDYYFLSCFLTLCSFKRRSYWHFIPGSGATSLCWVRREITNS